MPIFFPSKLRDQFFAMTDYLLFIPTDSTCSCLCTAAALLSRVGYEPVL